MDLCYLRLIRGCLVFLRVCINLLLLKKRPKEGKGFVYQGSISMLELKGFLDEKGLKVVNFIKVIVNVEDYYRFPLVFGVDV